jgi:hypothetical protein
MAMATQPSACLGRVSNQSRLRVLQTAGFTFPSTARARRFRPYSRCCLAGKQDYKSGMPTGVSELFLVLICSPASTISPFTETARLAGPQRESAREGAAKNSEDAEQSCWSGCRARAPVCVQRSLPRHHSSRAFGDLRYRMLCFVNCARNARRPCMKRFAQTSPAMSPRGATCVRSVSRLPNLPRRTHGWRCRRPVAGTAAGSQ